MDTKYKLWFLIMPAAILAGICLGSISVAKTGGAALFTTAHASFASPSLMTDSFVKAIRQNAGSAALLCVFGTSFLGALPSAVLLGIRGYGLGQTVGALVSAFGFRGFFAAVCGIFPHNLIYVPVLCLMSMCGARFSQRLLCRDHDARRHLVSYFGAVLLLAIPMLLGCLIEGYVSAPLLRNMLGSVL